MKNYLVKITFDCNDDLLTGGKMIPGGKRWFISYSDYVYGLKVINEIEKEIIDRNMSKSVNFGSYNVGEGTHRKLEDCINIEEITEEQVKVLKELNLTCFGEGEYFYIDELDDADEY